MTSFLNYLRNMPLGSTTLGQAMSNLSTALNQMSQTHVVHPQMQPIIDEFLQHPETLLQQIPVTWQADAGVIEFYAVALRCRNQLQGRPQLETPGSWGFGGNPIVTTSLMTLEWSVYQLLRRINSARVANIHLDYGHRFSQLVQPLSQVMTPVPAEAEIDPLNSTPESPTDSVIISHQ
jgi:hypothetical protein